MLCSILTSYMVSWLVITRAQYLMMFVLFFPMMICTYTQNQLVHMMRCISKSESNQN